MRDIKELNEIAKIILGLEKQCYSGDNSDLSKNMKLMDEIASNLSLEDLIYIDNYIVNTLDNEKDF